MQKNFAHNFKLVPTLPEKDIFAVGVGMGAEKRAVFIYGDRLKWEHQNRAGGDGEI